jgi:hypothetical protein
MNKIEIDGKNKNGKNILIVTDVHENELTSIYCGYLLNVYKENYDVNKFKKNYNN